MRKKQYVIHIDITDNEIEKEMGTYKELIDEFPYDTSTAIMEYCVNKNLDGIHRKYLNEINEIVVDGE